MLCRAVGSPPLLLAGKASDEVWSWAQVLGLWSKQAWRIWLTCTSWGRKQCNKGGFNAWGACLWRTSAWATLMSHSIFCLRVLFCLSVHHGAGFELSKQYRQEAGLSCTILLLAQELGSGSCKRQGKPFPHAQPMGEWKSFFLSRLFVETWKEAAECLSWLLQPGPVSWRCQGRNNLLKITWLPPAPFSVLPPCSPTLTVASS